MYIWVGVGVNTHMKAMPLDLSLLFLIIYIWVGVNTHMKAIPLEARKRLQFPSGAGVTGGCEYLTWALGTELRSFSRAVLALNS